MWVVSLKLFTYLHMLSFEILTLARLVSHMLTDPSPTRKIYLVLMNNSCSFRFLSSHFCEDDVIDTIMMFGYSSTDNCMFSKQNFCSWDYYIYMRISVWLIENDIILLLWKREDFKEFVLGQPVNVYSNWARKQTYDLWWLLRIELFIMNIICSYISSNILP